MNAISERRLAENEVVFRQLNEQVKKSIDEVNRLAEEHGQPEFRIEQFNDNAPVHFYCECSDEQCAGRVKVGYHEYNDIHKRRDRFVILPGNESKTVERVVRQEQNFSVVEKDVMPPAHVKGLQPTDIHNV